MNAKPMLTLAAACGVCLPTVAMAQSATSKGKRTEAAKPEVTDTATDVTVTYEAFSMETAKAIALRREHPTDAALYTALIAGVEKGDAAQEALAAARGVSGSKHFTQSASELIYPTEWEPMEFPKHPQQGQAGNIYAVPTSFETRYVGLNFQIEPEVTKGSPVILLKISPEHVTYTGNSVWGQGNWAVEEPEFMSFGKPSEVRVKNGEPFFLGTPSPQKSKERSPERLWFSFATSSVTTLETKRPPSSETPFKAGEASEDEPPMPSYSFTYEAFSLPLNEAASLRRKSMSEADLHKELVARVAKGEARQEAFTVARGNGYARINAGGGTEHISPTEYDSAELTDPKLAEQLAENIQLPFVPTAFETRNCGTEITIDASPGTDRTWLSLTAILSHVTLGEPVKWGKEVAQTERPLYESQALNASLTTLLGTPCFVGTLNPPDGLKAEPKPDKRVWFAFITPDLAK